MRGLRARNRHLDCRSAKTRRRSRSTRDVSSRRMDSMRKLATMLCGLVLGLTISATAVQAEDEESVCAGETVDELLDKATKLLDEKKVDDFVANCFSEAAVKKMEADKSKDM